MNAKAKKLLGAIQKRGCDARDLRDAAHEAHHALFVRLRGSWDRERIHEALVRRARRESKLYLNETLVRYELYARAVEWTVCERFKLPYEVEHWVDIMWWETLKHMNIKLPEVNEIAEAIKIAKGQWSTSRYADAVIALGARA